MAVVAGLLPALSAASATAEPTCEGRPATLVGHPDTNGTINGTSGDDVIVTRGIGLVNAGAGDDLVCVTGTNADHRQSVWGSKGNDRVVVRTSDDLDAELGQGDDTFLGGPGNDFVHGEAPITTGPGPEQVEGLDRISSGGGADEIVIGLPGATTRDVVDLGAGDDLLQVIGTLSPETGLRGGGGSDHLWPTPDTTGHDWVVDNTLETASMDGVVQFRWDSLEGFSLTPFQADTLTFTGSDAAETVSADSELVAASLGGGDDSLGMSLLRFPADHLPEVFAGPGRDVFLASSWEAVTVDLAVDAAWGETGSASDPDVLLDGFEDAVGQAEQVRLVGDAGDNLLDGNGCDVVGTGGAGDDRMLSTWEYDEHSCGRTDSQVFFSGGRGRDVLHGEHGPDRLVGGPGHDIAVGDKGTDRCRAEVRRSCELR